MSLIKITGKHLNVGLKFEHPIALNPEKKYKLDASRLMFSFDTKIKTDTSFVFFIPIPHTSDYFNVNAHITGDYTINSLQEEFKQICDGGFILLFERYKNNQKLKELEIARVKFELKNLTDDKYVVVFNFTFRFQVTAGSDEGFCKLFKFQPETMLEPNIYYTSENIKEMVEPFSVIEWHCNITEYSYTNHDDNPYLHKHNELFHVSFVNMNIYDTPAYKEIF